MAEDGECRNLHRSVRALPAARGHAGRITCRHDIAGHSLNARLCRVPAYQVRPSHARELEQGLYGAARAVDGGLTVSLTAGLSGCAGVRRGGLARARRWPGQGTRPGGERGRLRCRSGNGVRRGALVAAAIAWSGAGRGRCRRFGPRRRVRGCDATGAERDAMVDPVGDLPRRGAGFGHPVCCFADMPARAARTAPRMCSAPYIASREIRLGAARFRADHHHATRYREQGIHVAAVEEPARARPVHRGNRRPRQGRPGDRGGSARRHATAPPSPWRP